MVRTATGRKTQTTTFSIMDQTIMEISKNLNQKITLFGDIWETQPLIQ